MSKPSTQAHARVRALQDDPAFDRLRSVRARRGLTLVAFGLLAVAVGAVWVDSLMVGLLVGALTVAAGTALRRTVRLTADAPDEALGERQIARRDAAYRFAYILLATGIMLTLLVLYIAADAPRIGFDLEPRHLHALFWSVTGLGMLLPSAVLAWREPRI